MKKLYYLTVIFLIYVLGHSQTPIHNFEFNGNLNDSQPTGKVLQQPVASNNSFSTNPNQWNWTATQAPGGGLFLSTEDLPNPENYTLALDFSFSDVSGKRKILSFGDYFENKGVYFLAGGIDQVDGSIYGFGTLSANTFYKLILTRNATTKELKTYIIGPSGVLQLLGSLTDTNNDAVPVNSSVNLRDFTFFLDDASTNTEYTPSGSVRFIKIWDTPLSEAQLNTLFPSPLPSITSLSSLSGCTGSTLVINGTNLSGVQTVTIGGTAATVVSTAATNVTVTVGNGTTGTVAVTSPSGTATSTDVFTVTSSGALGSSCNPFTNVNQVTSSTPNGSYYFNLGGTTIQTKVENGWVLIANDSGAPVSQDLQEVTLLDENVRGILSLSILTNLGTIDNVNIRSSDGALDVKSNNNDIINRIKASQTIHQGQADNGINDSWSGASDANIKEDATCVTMFGTSLKGNIIHVCGPATGTTWIPKIGVRRIVDGSGNVADAVSFGLWVQKITPPTITSLSATSGSCGSSLTINGTFLNNTQTVYIGGTPAAIVGTTASSVTVTVGIGTTGTVSVTTEGGTATSSEVFTVTLGGILGSICNPFTNINQVTTTTPNGSYFFTIGGTTFESKVENGFILIANDVGAPLSQDLQEVTNLDVTIRGIVSNSVLSNLGAIEEIKIRSSDGVLDVKTTNTTLINRIATGQTLHQGQADNVINDSWSGASDANIKEDATCTTTFGTSLKGNIIHVCGPTTGTTWIPIIGVRRIADGIGNVADAISFGLWIKPKASVIVAGVNGGNLWLKANEGVTNSGSNLTGWTDLTGINVFTKQGSIGYVDYAINFNPIVSFNNTDSRTVVPTNRLEGNRNISFVDGFAVYKYTSTSNRGALVGGTLSATNYGYAIFAADNDLRVYAGNGLNSTYQSFAQPNLDKSFSIANLDISLANSPYATGGLNGVNQTISSGTGQGTPDFANINFIPMIGGTSNIGGDNAGSGWFPFHGEVAEVVLFPSSLSATDKKKVESYLAIKYGISLGNNTDAVAYTSSAGTSIWTANSTYKYDIFGIGKDDASTLNQPQSNSINTGSGDGTGQNGKGNIVLSNPSSLDNGDFLMIGHDNAALTEITTDIPVSLSGNCFRRLAREWKVRHTGDAGTLQMSFDWNGIAVNGSLPQIPDSYYIIIDTDGDGDFTTGTPITSNVGGFSSANVLSYNGVTLPDGAVFTFGISKSINWTGATSSDWNVTSNWNTNSLPNASNCVTIPATANNPIISTGFNAEAGQLTIQSGASVTINADGFLTVTDNIVLEGNLILEDHASLIQINDVANTATTGSMTLKRTASLRNFDYVYWSSPVASFNVNAISPLTTIAPELKWMPTIGTNLNGFGNWENTSENMTLGRGYAVRAPDGFSATPAPFTTSFIGLPNNGTITTPISRGTYDGVPYDNDSNPATADATQNDDNFNLIGNPYPSAISAIAFLNANPNVDGFVNIWSHGTLPSSAVTSPFYSTFVYNYAPTDYITYNKSGQSSGPGSFNGNIASGQAFFVLMKSNTAATTENVTFTNAMRSTSYDNDHFFRNPSEEGRIWLDVVAQDDTHLRTLVAYVDGATNSIDRDFDALTDKKPIVNIFSICEGKEFKIQGRPTPLNQDDEIPIGVTIPFNGFHHIAIGALDGIFLDPSQDIFLEDLELNEIHDLKADPYFFAEVQGVIENRFILKFKNTLSNPNNDVIKDKVLAVYGEQITVKSQNQLIQSIKVFDVLGREIKNYKDINNQEQVLKDLPKNKDLKILKVTLENETVVTLKVVY